MNTAETTTAVISEARTMTTLTAAAFDHDIAVRGIGGLYGPLGQATYKIVQDGMPNASTDDVETAWNAVWVEIQPELTAYAARCKNRSYSGWSNVNPSPIRYAN